MSRVIVAEVVMKATCIGVLHDLAKVCNASEAEPITYRVVAATYAAGWKGITDVYTEI